MSNPQAQSDRGATVISKYVTQNDHFLPPFQPSPLINQMIGKPN